MDKEGKEGGRKGNCITGEEIKVMIVKPGYP